MLRNDRPGFALPLALMVMMILTVGVATAFTRVQSEARQDHDRQVRTDAFAYAESGLEQFAANRVQLGFTSAPPAVSESTRIAMQGGYADVVLRRVRNKTATSKAVYLLRSRGVRNGGSAAIMGSAMHTVTQYGFYREGEMQVLSAWTSLTGLLKNGTAGTITGVDNCSVMPDVAGVAVPDAGYVQSGGASVPTGTPPILYLGTPSQTSDAVKIDWDGIVNQNLIWPDLVYPTDPWPNFAANPNYYPVIRVNGDLSLPDDGQGLLIVTGNMIINGSMRWKGVLLVGGTMYANGNNNVLGAVISGLNVKLGMTVGMSDVGNGTKTYKYDSCEIEKTLGNLSTLVLMGKTWSDTWPSY
jgi:Tfp pilus assembly protein PilX